MTPTWRTKKPLTLADGTQLPAGAELPPMHPRDLARLKAKGAKLEAIDQRRRIRLTSAIRWAGRHTEAGTELVVSAQFARRMVGGNKATDLGDASGEELSP